MRILPMAFCYCIKGDREFIDLTHDISAVLTPIRDRKWLAEYMSALILTS
ncbi:hypothetical protein [Hydrococcus rivularis]|nr:hypothetical protein [Hydrococcus rivularis]